ncbi:MAG: hypothetical protein HY893_07305 [Deltaproteobacteria bacterium]|nr:hypothetical protein [Deltaproteobacteria bacterium]
MNLMSFVFLIGLLLAMVFLYRFADRWIKKMDPGTVKKANKAGFIIGVAGGIGWYLLHYSVFMLITVAGVIIYFLFYGYDREESSEG